MLSELSDVNLSCNDDKCSTVSAGSDDGRTACSVCASESFDENEKQAIGDRDLQDASLNDIEQL